jgi:23S rRNA (guanosine2251-2'-O)-methyltransferase
VTKDRPRNRPPRRENHGVRGDAPRTPDALDAEAPWTGRSPGKQGGRGRPDHRRGPGGRPFRREGADPDEVWIWGLHAARAARANPRRRMFESLVTRNAALRLDLDPAQLPDDVVLVEPDAIDRRLPDGAVHQGVALRVAPLEPLELRDAILRPERPLVILDQVTDPQNVGAILRSAAAFGLGGVILQTRNAPALGGALAKAAAGAVETVEEIRVVNIARAVSELVDAGWCVVGLDGQAPALIEAALETPMPVAVVLGAEGSGLRPGVAAACSRLARIPIDFGMESLNVSNAAAVTFYELTRRRRRIE